LLYRLLVIGRGRLIPRPRVLEGVNLRRRLGTVLGEQDVVAGVRVEGRIEVDEIDALVLDVPPQDVEVVGLVEEVLVHA
jgi:hypothetical protein